MQPNQNQSDEDRAREERILALEAERDRRREELRLQTEEVQRLREERARLAASVRAKEDAAARRRDGQ